MNSVFGKLKRGMILWGNDFQQSSDDKGVVTATHTFACFHDEVLRLVPKVGAPCVEPGYGVLKRTTYKSEKKLDYALVTCTYSSYVGTEVNYEYDTNGYSYQGSVFTTQDSLLNHERYREIPQAEREIIVLVYDTASVRSAPGSYTFIVPIDHLEADYTITSDLGKELIDKLLAGKNENYYKPGHIQNISYTSNLKPNDALQGKVGKIYSGKGVSDIGTKNWLLTGVPYSKTNGVYTITLELLLSDEGGWDEQLYGN